MSEPVDYPDRIEITPAAGPIDADVDVPGSKSVTNRAMILAALAADPVAGCTLTGALHSEDTEVMAESLRRLGFDVECDWPAASVRVGRDAGRVIPADAADLFVANSGTSMRFLTALVSLGRGRYRLDGIARMRERPIADLLAALESLGVAAASEAGTGCPPVVVEGGGLAGGTARVGGSVSSQFLSALLMVAPFAKSATRLEIDGEMVSRPYVEMTTRVLAQWGLRVESDGSRYEVSAPQPAAVSAYDVEPDASAASYFWAAAAVTGGRCKVRRLGRDSLQGDIAFVDALARMGCTVTDAADGIEVRGGPLRGIDIDMNAISDTVMTLAAVAALADGPTVIRDVGHIRHKETDRLAATAAELRRVGCGVEERADGLTVTPGPLHGAEIQTYNDHRMAMSLALVGLRVPGVVILDPKCVAKTYPRFFHDLAAAVPR